MRRRDFLPGVAGAPCFGLAAGAGYGTNEPANQEGAWRSGLAGRRFLTFNSVIRVNQIEVTQASRRCFRLYAPEILVQ
jgi:hypothetical protein